MFVSFEGIDGCGKTTQLRLLAAWLEDGGHPVVVTREPGGTSLAEGVRALILHPGAPLSPTTELLLFGAARAQHVAEIVKPALEGGAWVLSDRFADSSLAYQGGGLGLDTGFISAMNAFATAGLRPELTLLFDVDPAIGARRRHGELEDQIEARGLPFQERVRARYLELARSEPGRFIVIDATPDPATVAGAVRRAVVDRLASAA